MGPLLAGMDIRVCTGKTGSKQMRDTQEFPRRPKVRAFQVHRTAEAKGSEMGMNDVHESTCSPVDKGRER